MAFFLRTGCTFNKCPVRAGDSKDLEVVQNSIRHLTWTCMFWGQVFFEMHLDWLLCSMHVNEMTQRILHISGWGWICPQIYLWAFRIYGHLFGVAVIIFVNNFVEAGAGIIIMPPIMQHKMILKKDEDTTWTMPMALTYLEEIKTRRELKCKPFAIIPAVR